MSSAQPRAVAVDNVVAAADAAFLAEIGQERAVVRFGTIGPDSAGFVDNAYVVKKLVQRPELGGEHELVESCYVHLMPKILVKKPHAVEICWQKCSM